MIPGERLGPYEIAAQLGQGGMGEVFRARDTRLHRTVAIKLVRPEFARRADFRERFQREARAISALNHPHICGLYDIGEQNGVDFLVMEYVEGESLAACLKRGPVAPELVLQNRTVTTFLPAVVVWIAAFALCRLQAQPPSEPRFEVASVRVANQQPPRRPIELSGEIKGGPGTEDPERITYQWVSMNVILQTVFGLSDDQILNQPDWAYQTRFDIVAKAPPGTTKDQANQMMQNLLKQRFNLSYHFVKKTYAEFNLVVAKDGLAKNGLAKNGPKLKEAALPDGPPPPRPDLGVPAPTPSLDRDRYPILPAGYPNFIGFATDGVSYTTFRSTTLADLVRLLRLNVGARVVDQTGLTGKYDFKLEYAASGDPAPDLFAALEKQLGLKLEKTTLPLDALVIDHLDQKPSDN
jgi:uncharacterized protein (TIGR03435 family)